MPLANSLKVLVYATGSNPGSLNGSARTIMAQAMRTILLASATVVQQFKALGLEQVRRQELEMSPLWYPSSGMQVLRRRFHGASRAGSNTIVAPAIWLGIGAAADFKDRDVSGKQGSPSFIVIRRLAAAITLQVEGVYDARQQGRCGDGSHCYGYTHAPSFHVIDHIFYHSDVDTAVWCRHRASRQ